MKTIYLNIFKTNGTEWDVPQVCYFTTAKEARQYTLNLTGIEAYWIRKIDSIGHYKTIEAKEV